LTFSFCCAKKETKTVRGREMKIRQRIWDKDLHLWFSKRFLNFTYYTQWNWVDWRIVEIKKLVLGFRS